MGFGDRNQPRFYNGQSNRRGTVLDAYNSRRSRFDGVLSCMYDLIPCPVEVRGVAGMDSLTKSNLEQALNPGSHGSLAHRPVQH